MRQRLDHIACGNLRIGQRFWNRADSAARHAFAPERFDQRSNRPRAQHFGKRRSQFFVVRDPAGVRLIARVSPKSLQIKRGAEPLPLPVISNGEHDNAIRGFVGVVRRDRHVPVAGARRHFTRGEVPAGLVREKRRNGVEQAHIDELSAIRPSAREQRK
jgi:hypothetical protein